MSDQEKAKEGLGVAACSALLGPFLDEIDAMKPETDFWARVCHENSPSHLQGLPHRSDGGTTVVWQDGRPVGISVRFRDDHNCTMLALIDFKPNT
jgi:hypothetical protein